MISARLRRAYLSTRYRAGSVAVRIGWHNHDLDALLADLATRTAVFVTAWNPLSRRKPDGWNRRMQRRLGERLRRYRTLCASGSLRRWREEHLLVVADPRPVTRLARLFHQRGEVVIRRGQPAQLVLLCYRQSRADW